MKLTLIKPSVGRNHLAFWFMAAGCHLGAMHYGHGTIGTTFDVVRTGSFCLNNIDYINCSSHWITIKWWHTYLASGCSREPIYRIGKRSNNPITSVAISLLQSLPEYVSICLPRPTKYCRLLREPPKKTVKASRRHLTEAGLHYTIDRGMKTLLSVTWRKQQAILRM